MSLIVESLDTDKHRRNDFSCGVRELDDYLKTKAGQAPKKRLSRTYVIVDRTDSTEILGYYTLAGIEIDAAEFPATLVKKYRFPAPAMPGAIVARLAVSKEHRRRGIGRLLIVDALHRCIDSSERIGGVAIVVDAKSEDAVAFYEASGFIRFDRTSMRLFMSVDAAIATVSPASTTTMDSRSPSG